MPHATISYTVLPKDKQARHVLKSKSRSPSRELQHLQTRFEEVQAHYRTSHLSTSMERLVQQASKSSGPSINRMLSLGLGSLTPIKTQSRRLKQLAIFLAIADTLEDTLQKPVALLAQDPTFTKTDEAFLNTFGIGVIRTPSGAELGEARQVLDERTLVYSPFLTLEAYEQLMLHAGQHVKHIVGDDFNALLEKWPKHSPEEAQVKRVMKGGILRFRRQAVIGDGFWEEEIDGAFPMAMYSARGAARI